MFISCFPSMRRTLTARDATATDLPLPPPRTYKELRELDDHRGATRWRTHPKLKTNQKNLHYRLSGCQGLLSVLDVIEEGQVDNWDSLNLATAWHRLARAVRDNRDDAKTDALDQRVAIAQRRLDEAVELMGPDAFGGRELGNIIYAWGISGYKTRLLKRFCGSAAFRLREMGPQGVANSIYALGLQGYRDETFLNEVGKTLPSRVADFKPQELSSMINAFGRLRLVPEGGLLEAICEHIERHLEEFKAQEISNMFLSLARLEFKDRKFLKSLCRHLKTRVSHLEPKHICNMLDSMVKLRIRHRGILMAFSELVANRIPELNRQKLLVRITRDLQTLQEGMKSRRVS